MTAIYFDTLEYVKSLVKAGFTEKQAETLAKEQTKLIKEDLATKKDLIDLEQRLTIKMGGMFIVAVTVIAALVKMI
jgi:hypothetical protein